MDSIASEQETSKPKQAQRTPVDLDISHLSNRVEMYTNDGLEGALRQGSIISGVREYSVDPVANEINTITYPFAVVATQDCDLDWDYKYRKDQAKQSKEVRRVLLFEALETSRLGPGFSQRRLTNHQDERYYLLQGGPVQGIDERLPELLLDFKNCFAIPLGGVGGLYWQIEQGIVRPCALLLHPFREHLQYRMKTYLGRVGLPNPYQSE